VWSELFWTHPSKPLGLQLVAGAEIKAPTHNKRSGVWVWANGINGPGYKSREIENVAEWKPQFDVNGGWCVQCVPFAGNELLIACTFEVHEGGITADVQAGLSWGRSLAEVIHSTPRLVSPRKQGTDVGTDSRYYRKTTLSHTKRLKQRYAPAQFAPSRRVRYARRRRVTAAA